ncbi:MAG TPA: hypothetical protein VGH74_01250 [Planctomycetaceae bacterium]|jgi:hypothetical protein
MIPMHREKLKAEREAIDKRWQEALDCWLPALAQFGPAIDGLRHALQQGQLAEAATLIDEMSFPRGVIEPVGERTVCALAFMAVDEMIVRAMTANVQRDARK